MRVQFAVGDRTGSDRLTLGRTVLPPGARHEPHSHPHCDEFLFVVRGRGTIYTDEGEEPAAEDDVIFTSAGHVHGFNNTSEDDVLLLWGWSGAGSLGAAGYELHSHR
jgi:quercetin dioxygenase-like cupin family protein